MSMTPDDEVVADEALEAMQGGSGSSESGTTRIHRLRSTDGDND